MPGLLPCDNRSYKTGTAGTGRFGTKGIKNREISGSKLIVSHLMTLKKLF
jgi:hypothetical protein